MSVSIGAMSAAKVLRNQGGIWSGPQALLGFDEDSCFKTPCSEIMKDPKPGVGSAHFWNVLKVLRSKKKNVILLEVWKIYTYKLLCQTLLSL